MAFVVEDGTGRPDATSYADVAFANDYHETFGNTQWAALSDEDKQIALNKATRYIDGLYDFVGKRRTYRNQALKWPRISARREQGWLIPNGQIPAETKKAASELALLTSDGTDLDPNRSHASQSGQVIEEYIKIDIIEERTRYAEGASGELYVVFTRPDGLLNPIVNDNCSFVRS